MKKKIIYAVIFIILVLLVIFGVFLFEKNDAKTFKQEYEKDNKTMQRLRINEDNKIKYVSEEEAIETIRKKTGLIFIGSPKSSVTRMMVPALLDAADCTCISNILYLDAKVIRDDAKLKELLDKYLDTNNEYDDDVVTIVKVLELPTIIGVKNGKIKGVITDLVELNDNQDLTSVLTAKQTRELKSRYIELIEEVLKEDEVCEEHC